MNHISFKSFSFRLLKQVSCAKTTFDFAATSKSSSSNRSRCSFHGFEHEELQSSLRYLQKWDLLMSRFIKPKDLDPTKKMDCLLKKSHMRYLCTKCSSEFAYKRDLQKHTNYRCGQGKRFKCPYCKYKCHWTSGIYRHIRSHHPTSRIFCMDTCTGQPFNGSVDE